MSEPPVPDLSAVASPPPESLAFEDFQIAESPLAEGGQAVVYEATVPTESTVERVVVKQPTGGRKTVQHAVMDEFLSEAETWEMLSRKEREKRRYNRSKEYEHIVGVVDTGEKPYPWIAMEYMDGGSLADRLEEEPDGLPIKQALWIGERLCRGVELAHNEGIAHLDLKPANILFRETDNDSWDVPKIADWGIARDLATERDTTERISEAYAAPEQFDLDNVGSPDNATDIYQLGAVIYAMLAGKPPHGWGWASIKKRHTREELPKPPSDQRTVVPTAVDDIIQASLEPQKTDRYRNVTEFEKAIRAIRTDGRLSQIITKQIESSSTESKSAPDQNGDSNDNPESVQNRGSPTDPARHESWPMFQGDTARTGYNPCISAPDIPITEEWCFETGDERLSSPAVANGTIYMGTNETLYAVDAASGDEIWRFSEESKRGWGSPTVTNGTVFVGNHRGDSYALDSDTGEKQWDFEPSLFGPIRSSPACFNGFVYFCSSERIYAIDADSGDKQWIFKTNDEIWSSPAVADGIIYIGSRDNNLYALDAITGEKKWHLNTNDEVQSSPAVVGDCVFIGSWNNLLYAVDSATGDKLWHYKTVGPVTSPAISEETAYVTAGFKIYAVDAKTGEKQWHFDTGDMVYSPVVADGTVFVGSRDTNLYAVDTSTGEEVWHHQIGDQINSSPAVADGTVFVGSRDGNLYAISGE